MKRKKVLFDTSVAKLEYCKVECQIAARLMHYHHTILNAPLRKLVPLIQKCTDKRSVEAELRSWVLCSDLLVLE